MDLHHGGRRKRAGKKRKTKSRDTGKGNTPKRRQRALPLWDIDPMESPEAPVAYFKKINRIIGYTQHPRFNYYRRFLIEKYGSDESMERLIDSAICCTFSQQIGERVLVANTSRIREEYGVNERYVRYTSPEAFDAVLSGTLTMITKMESIINGSLQGAKVPR